MTTKAAEVFHNASTAMEIILPGLVEWADTLLEGSERAEALHHIGKLTDDFRILTTAVIDFTGVETE